MNHTELLKSVEAEKNANIPDLFPGDTVSVHTIIKEGDRERIQEFKGVVLMSAAMPTTALSPSAVLPAMVSAWSAPFSSIRPALRKWWLNATTKSAAPACTSCANAPARALA